MERESKGKQYKILFRANDPSFVSIGPHPRNPITGSTSSPSSSSQPAEAVVTVAELLTKDQHLNIILLFLFNIPLPPRPLQSAASPTPPTLLLCRTSSINHRPSIQSHHHQVIGPSPFVVLQHQQKNLFCGSVTQRKCVGGQLFLFDSVALALSSSSSFIDMVSKTCHADGRLLCTVGQSVSQSLAKIRSPGHGKALASSKRVVVGWGG